MQNFFALTHPSGGVWAKIRHLRLEIMVKMDILADYESCRCTLRKDGAESPVIVCQAGWRSSKTNLNKSNCDYRDVLAT